MAFFFKFIFVQVCQNVDKAREVLKEAIEVDGVSFFLSLLFLHLKRDCFSFLFIRIFLKYQWIFKNRVFSQCPSILT